MATQRKRVADLVEGDEVVGGQYLPEKSTPYAQYRWENGRVSFYDGGDAGTWTLRPDDLVDVVVPEPDSARLGCPQCGCPNAELRKGSATAEPDYEGFVKELVPTLASQHDIVCGGGLDRLCEKHHIPLGDA